MTTEYKVKLSHDDEQIVENVRLDCGIGNKENFTKLALLMFAEIYMKKKDQMEAEDAEVQDEEGS
jgi:hypothetical protein